jgi:hypothetical protein
LAGIDGHRCLYHGRAAGAQRQILLGGSLIRQGGHHRPPFHATILPVHT